MEIGWYHEFHRQVDKQSDTDAFAMGLDQMLRGGGRGRTCWLAEIHQQAR